MSRAALSVVAFAVYLFVIGPVLVLAPNLLLQLFGFEPTSEVWIRIVGGLACFLGYYYLMSGREENTGFMRWTTRARPLLLVFFVVLAALGLSKPQLILFGLVDLGGAIWTWRALVADAVLTRPAA